MSKLLSCLVLSVVLVAGMAMAEDSEYVPNDRGIDPANFDDSCDPCKDFYQFSNGTWLANNPIPAEWGSWSVWHEMHERNQDMLKTILEEASARTDAATGTTDQQIGDFYACAMDTAAINALGIKPLKPVLKRVAAINSIASLRQEIAALHLQGVGVAFDIGAEQDLKDNTKVIAYATQGGLGLPDRDYYTRKDEESVKLREQYVDHVARMFQLLGDDEMTAKAHAQTVMEIETRLAQASLTNLELRDPNVYYNLMTVEDASLAMPNFDWRAYFDDLGLNEVTSFSFAMPNFFAEFDALLEERSIDDWKTYCRWHVVSDAAPFLSDPFVDQNFAFFGTALNGVEKLQPRWKRVMNVLNGSLGEAVGQLYVKEAFPPEYKERALKMVGDLTDALKERIEKLEWMSEETKEKALAKWASFTPKIGYPDKWKDYSSLAVTRDDYLGNVYRAQEFAVRDNLDNIGKPVDKTEWGMSPQTVNAYYNPLLNEIVFPAAILQPPFFDGEADDAINYGSMGVIIGHELMHGYDDQGSQFDADGNLANWWTEEDRERFEARTQRLEKQFSEYEAIPGVHVNGELTLGENIADLGGLVIAYAALQSALGEKPVEMIDGFNPEQRFFLSWSQTWRTNMRDEQLKLQINTDPHSPGPFRVNGPLSNLTEFHRAFGCQDGDPMVRSDTAQIQIW